MKKLVSLIMCIVLMLLSFTYEDISASAIWGMEGPYYYSVEDGEATIESYNGIAEGKVEIPETLGGYPVTAIGDYVFSFEEKLTDAIIPDTVKYIGEGAFYATRFYYDRANWTGELLYIDGHLIDSGTLLGKIKVKDGTKSISNAVFTYSDMTEITIPKSVLYIGADNFTECEKLKRIDVDAGNPVFYSDENGILFTKDKIIKVPAATQITKFRLPEEVEIICEGAFENTSLTDIVIPQNVKEIPDNAFKGCKNLKYVTICGNIERIGYDAFSGCDRLGYVFFEEYSSFYNIDIFNGNEVLNKVIIRTGFTNGICIASPYVETLVYGDKLVLSLITANGLDENSTLTWGADSEAVKLSVSEDGKSCTVTPSVKGNGFEYAWINVSATDEEGNMKTDMIDIKVDCRWYQKILAFFRMIFGLTTVIRF